MLKRILITGGTGLLGKTLIEQTPANFYVHATNCRPETQSLLSCPSSSLDITNQREVERVFEEARPEVVVHAAGAGNVDFAEHNREEAWQINVGGTKHIVEACRRSGSKLIFLSTNAIFDGENPPYDEESKRCPINYYGQLKVEAEDVVTNSAIESAIVRPILMYGWNHSLGRKNPVTIWLDALASGKPVKVVNDRFWQPLFVEDCAEVVWRLIETGKHGIYHVASPNRLSLFDFALETAHVFGLSNQTIEPVPSSFFPTIAPRPVDTSFRTDKIQSELGVYPSATYAGLERMKRSVTA